jgi:putative hydrolase of the HAD superfamily
MAIPRRTRTSFPWRLCGYIVFLPAMDQSVKNLVFDLGGVILDLAVDQTIQAFANLAGISAEKATSIFHTSPEFNLYEKGGMTDQEFRDFLKSAYTPNASDAEIDKAWNQMLRSMPIRKLDLLENLKKQYRVLLLSNTNEIHLSYINANLLPKEAKSLDQYFHKAYYSHRMLKRKPDTEIFEQVLDENNLIPGQTLFLDDNLLNVKGAESVGIKTVHVTYPDLILKYFNV